MTVPIPFTCHRVKLSPGKSAPCPCLPYTEAKRSEQTERRREGGFGGLPRQRQSNSHARRRRPSREQRPGQAQRKKGGPGVFLDYGNPTRTRAEDELAEHSGQAEAAEKGCSGFPPTTAQHSTPTRRRKPRAAAGRAQRRGGVRGSPPTLRIQLAHTPKKA
jgi:hypothetical protein